jgi:hypothetical protein
MTQQPQPPWPGGDLARELTEAWSSWVKASAGAAGGSARPPGDPLAQLATMFAGYAGSISAPLRELAGQHRELAESMARWAVLQRELAEQVEAWAEHQRTLADTLEATLAPFAAWLPEHGTQPS